MGGESTSGRDDSRMSGSDLDINASITLSFEEAALGTQKTVSYTRSEACSPCKGSGVKSGSTRSACNACYGTGQVWTVVTFIFRSKKRCRDFYLAKRVEAALERDIHL